MNKYEQDQMCNEAVAQVEEMAKDIKNACYKTKNCFYENEIRDCDKCRAKWLFKLKYRKLPEDSVVLPKSEYTDLKEFADKYIESLHKDKCLGTDSVVLSREEYEEYKKVADGKAIMVENITDVNKLVQFPIEYNNLKFESMDDYSNYIQDEARKETVEKFAGLLFKYITTPEVWAELRTLWLRIDGDKKANLPIWNLLIEPVVKQFSVEIGGNDGRTEN